MLSKIALKGREILLKAGPVSSFETAGEKGSRVFYLNEGASVAEALASMHKNHVHCLPLKTRAGAHMAFTAAVDLMDLVFLVLDGQQPGVAPSHAAPCTVATEFLDTPAVRVANLSHRNPWKPIGPETPVEEAAELMVEWGVHRLPVVDNEGNLLSLLTASRLIAHVFKHVARLGSVGQRSLFELGVGRKPVVSVTPDVSLVMAVQLMRDRRVAGLAVVDANCKLVGNVSLSDLANVLLSGAPPPGAPADAGRGFLVLKHLFEPLSASVLAPTNQRREPVVVHPDDSLADTIEKMATERVHRVFVTARDGRPLGVLSQLDVLSIITGHAR